MSYTRIIILLSLTMILFASNSLLCRAALKNTSIDAASFTTIRLISGAIIPWVIVRTNHGTHVGGGNWPSAFMLFVYAAGFSFAYVSLSAATGALLLVSAVEATMMSHGIWLGERLARSTASRPSPRLQWIYRSVAARAHGPSFGRFHIDVSCRGGLGIYSIRGRGAEDPVKATAGNLLRAVPMAIGLSILTFKGATLDNAGVCYAVASGELASGIGYSIWYMALPTLKATSAAIVQLSVPVIATLGGLVLLGEPITLRLALACVAILGGIALAILEKRNGNRTDKIKSFGI